MIIYYYVPKAKYRILRSLFDNLFSVLISSLCHMIPGFSKLLLPRINPFVLVAFAGALALIVVHILIDMK